MIIQRCRRHSKFPANLKIVPLLVPAVPKIGQNLDKRPHNPILWVGNDNVAAVLEELQRHPHTAPRVPVSAEEFLTYFKRSYAEGMNWRMKKGGVSRAEIRRQMASKGHEINEEVVENIYKNMRAAHIEEVRRGCLAQYLDTTKKRRRPNGNDCKIVALVIPETLENEELIALFESSLGLDQEQREALRRLRPSGPTALETVDEMLVRDFAGLGLTKLSAETHEPIHAYVVLKPDIQETAPQALAACNRSMSPLLASVLIIAIVCVASVILGFLWVRAKLRAKLAYHRAAGIHKFPQRLTVTSLQPFTWRKLNRASKRVDAFRELGFMDLGGFSVDELPKLRLFALQHPVSGLIGIVNEHEKLGTWSDVMMFLPEERQPILASGIAKHSHFFCFPAHPKSTSTTPPSTNWPRP